VRVPLTQELERQIEAFSLRSSCVHCRHYVAATRACGNGWPNDEQRRWPPADELPICKEFELR
jgi:hypothetical protein